MSTVYRVEKLTVFLPGIPAVAILFLYNYLKFIDILSFYIFGTEFE
jgi:hypothetical protein